MYYADSDIAQRFCLGAFSTGLAGSVTVLGYPKIAVARFSAVDEIIDKGRLLTAPVRPYRMYAVQGFPQARQNQSKIWEGNCHDTVVETY